MKKQILIGIDGSPTSFQSLDYTAHLFGHDHDVDFTLLNCHGHTSTAYPEPEDKTNSLTPQPISVKGSLKGHKLLDNARSRIESHHIDSNRINTLCNPASNIAKTIQAYAEKHLVDALVIARRGVGLVGELLLGSVSSALFEQSRTIPLWIIDGEIQSKRFLVPVDGTPSSLMALDHLAHMFAGRNDIEFYLFHARGFLSSPPICKPEDFYSKWGKDWCDTHLSGHGCMFTGPTELLTDTGIDKHCITTLPETSALEESTAIISKARKHNCGTIVIGRRPSQEAKGILGGVSKRTVLQTENLALWVIG